MTHAEVVLWKVLRSRSLSGTKFRRQVPYGPYILDFAVLAEKLIIEIDGDTHATPDGIAHDAARTAWLELRGWRILRFTNPEVRANLDGVLAAILIALNPNPHPSPLPTGEGAQAP